MRPLEMVTSFKYLGRVLSAADDYCPEVVQNLVKAWTVWRRMLRIMIREGVRPRLSGFSFKPSSNRCCSSVQRLGWLPPAWYDTWGGGVPGPFDKDNYREAPMVDAVRKVGVHLGGGRDGESGGGI